LCNDSSTDDQTICIDISLSKKSREGKEKREEKRDDERVKEKFFELNPKTIKCEKEEKISPDINEFVMSIEELQHQRQSKTLREMIQYE